MSRRLFPKRLTEKADRFLQLLLFFGYSFDRGNGTAVNGKVLIGIPSPDERVSYMRWYLVQRLLDVHHAKMVLGTSFVRCLMKMCKRRICIYRVAELH